MNTRRYDAILVRVEYPKENGYRMEPEVLPPWMYFTITETDTNKYLTVYSKIHKNKEVKLNPTYSKEFTDYEIIKDLSAEIYTKFIRT